VSKTALEVYDAVQQWRELFQTNFGKNVREVITRHSNRDFLMAKKFEDRAKRLSQFLPQLKEKSASDIRSRKARSMTALKSQAAEKGVNALIREVLL